MMKAVIILRKNLCQENKPRDSEEVADKNYSDKKLDISRLYFRKKP